MLSKFLTVIVGLATLALFVGEASAAGVKLTEQQVRTVCGGGMRTMSRGVTGACGLHGEGRLER